DALRMLRGVTDTPIIIATARDNEAEIVRLLRAGADDYMVKPFSSAHLDARVTTVLRRTGRASRAEAAVIDVGGLRVDPNERQAWPSPRIRWRSGTRSRRPAVTRPIALASTGLSRSPWVICMQPMIRRWPPNRPGRSTWPTG